MRFSTLLVFWTLLGAVWQAHGQTPGQRVTLNWAGKATVFPQKGQGVQVPTFDDAVFEPGQRIPSVNLRLEGYVVDVQLQNAQYAPLTPAEAAPLNVGQPTPAAGFQLHHGTERHRPVTRASLPAVRRNSQTGQLEKLLSFDYTYNTGAAPQARTTSRTYAPNSVLRSGDWFKLGVVNTDLGNGSVYKLDKNFLRGLNLPVQSLDPRRLQLYGYGLGMLPQANRETRPDDLVENAIYFADNGSNNSTFDDDEYFLFYAQGPHTWKLNNQQFAHQLNLYTDTAYYFLTVGTTNGRRVAPQAAVTGTPTATISEFTDHFYYERDLVNLLKSGRQWLGEGFNPNIPQSFDFNGISDLVAGSPLFVTSSVAAKALPRFDYSNPTGTSTSFRVTLNGGVIGSQLVRNVSCDPTAPQCYPEVANTDLTVFQTTVPPGAVDLHVGLTYSGSPSDISAAGYLDYLEIQARRQLRLSNQALTFRSLENVAPNALSTFVVQNATANTQIWDVTDPRQPVSVAHTNGRFLARTNTVREYVAFNLNGGFGPAPRAFGRIANQNLHAKGLTSPVDLIIVTPPAFRSEAQRLANHRRDFDGLHPEVVTTNEIYNEFSSGGQDITAIRDFAKMIYDRAGGQAQELYILLFGDASYDYKADPGNDASKEPTWWKDRQVTNASNQNLVPTYEAISSFAPVGSPPSYCSDDYFGYLDDDEGGWAEDGTADRDMMDAGVGRLPIHFPTGQPNSTANASKVVNKLLSYDAPTALGKWRNRLTYVADDGDNNTHLFDAEAQANLRVALQQAFQVGKVYVDMFQQISLSGGQRSPDANAALDASIEQGSLLVSYSGHGGTHGWADEQILTNGSVMQLQNRDRLTFMLTATCDFAWYDDPNFDSAGEQVLVDAVGGAVGLLTTTRLVYANNNQAIAREFYNKLFQRTNGRWPRLGAAVMYAKNHNNVGVPNRNFTLLGDPSMRLAMPHYTVRTTRISDATDPRHQPMDTIRALQRVQLEGEVVDPVTGALQTSFGGKVQVTVYEKPSLVRTLGNENDTISVRVQRDVVYDGQASVSGGRFSVQFVVPKDINYRYGFGKVSLYAYDPNLNLDGQGANTNLVVGGAANTAFNDTIPPVIRLFMDTKQFVFGGLTKPDTRLLAELKDDSGINTAGTGIGHELTATLDHDPSKVTVLNEYYTATLNTYASGDVNYLFKNLTVGPHVLTLKAWDTYNNSAEESIEFIAAKDEKLAVEHILNYPNPFAGHTTFHFDHNRYGEALDVQVQIFTVSGKLVRTLTAAIPPDPGSRPHVSSISWDGRDEYNDQLARGVYVYRLSVRSPRDGSQVSKFEKLVLLN